MTDSMMTDPVFQCYASWPFFAGAALAGAAAYMALLVWSRRLRETGDKLLLAERKNGLLDKTIRRMMESSGEGIALLDERGRVASVNAAGERLLGLTRTELVGSLWTDVIAWLGGDKAAEAMALTRFENHSLVIKRRNGASERLRVSFGQLFELNNAKAGAVCVFSAATDERQAGGEAFRDFFEKASIGMGITDLDFKLTEVNEAMARMFGYTRQEMTGLKPLDLTYPEDVSPNVELQARISEGQIGAYRLEKRYIRKDGSVFWGIMSAALIKDAAGKPSHYIGQIQDITTLKDTEQALRESEHRHRQMVENSPVPIFVNAGHKIAYINPAAVAALGGRGPEDFIGKNPLDLTAPELRDFAARRTNEVFEKRAATALAETKFTRLDGTVMDVEILGTPITYQGAPAAEVMFLDVTERKTAEKALVASAREWASAMDFMEDAIYILDLDLRVKRANSAFYMLTGLTPDRIIGISIQEIMRHSPDVDCPVCSAQAERRDAIITLEADHPANPAGRPIETLVKMIRDQNGAPVEILVGIHDLTRQRAYEKALMESEEKYRTLVDRMRDGIVLAQDGKVKFANGAMGRMLGYTEEEAIGAEFVRFISPPLREAVSRRYADRMAGKPAENEYETRLVRKDGTEVDVDVSAGIITYEGSAAALVVVRDISERIRVRKALEESEAKYRILVGQIGEGVMVGQDGVVRLANQAMADMLGYTVEEMTGVPFDNLFSGEAGEVVWANYKARLAGQPAPAEYEAKFVRKDGEEIDVSISASLINFDGRPASLAAVRDITQMKQSNARLKESEDRYRQLVEGSPVPLYVHQDFKIVYINPAAIKALGGGGAEDLIGADLISMVTPEYAEFARERIASIYEGASTPLAGIKLVRKDGTVLDAEIMGTPVTYAGKPAGQTIFYDITERKKAEAALRESEGRFRMLFENSPDSMLLADVNSGTLLDANKAAEKLFLRSREEFIGTHQSALHPPVLEQAVREKFADRVTGVDPTIPAESMIIRSDGVEVPVEVTGQRLIINGKKVLMGVFRDVTWRKKAEDALKESEERYRQLAENSPVPVMLHADFKIEYINPAAVAALGGERVEDFLGANLLSFLRDQDKERARRRIAGVYGEQVASPLTEFEFTRRDGKVIVAESMATPVVYRGKPAAQTVFQDITSRKKAEAALRTQAAIMANIAEGVAMVRLGDNVIVHTNPKFDRMFGVEKGELIGRKARTLNKQEPGRMGDEVADATKAALAKDGLWEGAILNVKKDGTEFWTHNVVTPYKDEEHGDVMLIVKKDITQTRRVAEALRESEERYRALVENSNDCVCLLDIKGRFLFMNQRGLRMNGFTAMEQIAGKSCLSMIHRDFQPVMDGTLRRVARGETAHVTYTTPATGGGETWWESVMSPIVGKDGAVEAVLRISRDVTERKLAEEEIAGHHETLEAIGRAQTRFILGESEERMFGGLLDSVTSLSRSEFGFIGQVHRDAAGAPYLKSFAISWRTGDKKAKKFMRKGFRPGMEFRNLNTLYGAVLTSGEYVISENPANDPRSGGVPEGHPRLESFLGVPLKRGEELVGMIGLANRPGGYDEKTVERLEPFVATCAQLIEANRAEANRKKAETAVRHSEELLERLFSTTYVMLALLDRNMNFLKVNRAYAASDGKDVDFFPGKSHFALYPNEENEAIFRRVLNTGEPYESIAKPFVYEANPERGVTYWDVSVQPVKETDGKISGLLLSLLNVTARKRAEEQARIHQQQLIHADKMKSLGILVAGVAHEINNPNSFIAINAPLLKRIWEQGLPIMTRGLGSAEDVLLGGMPLAKALEAAPKLLDGISEGSRRIQTIVNRLKNFARAEPSGTRKPVDMNKAVETAVTLSAGLIRKHTRNFATELASGLPLVLGNQMEMEQVMINLISNALQALESVDKGVKVATSYDQKRDIVRVVVADEGCGIPPENLDKVTDPFFTTKRDKGGTGLGLSVSFGIVREHMGVMRFDSKPGAGATVTLEFPAINGEAW